MIDTAIVNGFEMEYVKFGSGNKVLVILPGISLVSVINSASAVEKQYEMFAKDYTLYLFDRKKNADEDYTVEEMADDTAKIM